MNEFDTQCAGCKGTISVGEQIWVSDLGEELVITHPLNECLKKAVSPENAFHVSERTVTTIDRDEPQKHGAHPTLD